MKFYQITFTAYQTFYGEASVVNSPKACQTIYHNVHIACQVMMLSTLLSWGTVLDEFLTVMLG